MVDTLPVMEELAKNAGPGVLWLLGFLVAALLLRMEDFLLVTGLVVSRVRRRTHAGR